MIRIIGIGSPFGDDRVGWRVVELLRDRLPAEVDLVALDRPGAALINWMEGVHWLILIDALSSGAAPGSLIRIDPGNLEHESRLSSHDLALSGTLRLAKSLGCLPSRIDIYGIELGDCQATTLSDASALSAIQLTSLIEDEVAQYLV
ncbi:MAG: hydrogenase maturation protease [Sedimenticolaceae bacterium]